MAISVLDYIQTKRKDQPRKIVIIGPSGAGKTTFLETFFGKIERSDVKRRHKIEAEVDDVYVALKNNTKDTQSTTTISMNQLRITLILTTSNRLLCLDPQEDLREYEIEKKLEINFVDNPGQARFDFMSSINLRGAAAVIIMLDGSSTASLSSLSKYVDMITDSDAVSAEEIPIMAFINKADLVDENLFIGKEAVVDLVGEVLQKQDLILFETSNLNPISFEFPLRTLLSLLD